MRALTTAMLMLVLVGCVRDAPNTVARCASCENLIDAPLATSNYTRAGPCRIEVRRGDSCCLGRWDVDKTAAADGGALQPSFDATNVSLCMGETFIVCGEEIECAPYRDGAAAQLCAKARAASGRALHVLRRPGQTALRDLELQAGRRLPLRSTQRRGVLSGAMGPRAPAQSTHAREARHL